MYIFIQLHNYLHTVFSLHVHLTRFLVLQADADEMQPQRISSREWTAQDHALFHSSRAVRQPWDPATVLMMRGADEWHRQVALFDQETVIMQCYAYAQM